MTNLSKSFDRKTILKNINFSLKDHEVVGLIGVNGSGKSTLFKILAGQLPSDGGNIQKGDEIIGYLPQNLDFQDVNVEDFLNYKLTDQNQKYQIDQVLNSLGLSNIDKKQLVNNLSGGQKTRLYFASLLVVNPQPTLLLLDEPTNNLDLEGLSWLEEFIKNFSGSVLLTSHDRAFLDETVDRIIELEDGELKNYGGNYSFYKERKLEEEKAKLQKYKENTVEVKRLEKLITEKKERARRLSKDKSSPDNDKMAAKFLAQKSIKIDRQAKAVESRLEHLEKSEKPQDRINYPVGFSGQVHSDKFIIGAKNVNKSYGNKLILDNISLTAMGNQHVWITGSNGSGKTTLLKILAGMLQLDKGIIEIGENIEVGYFSQEITSLGEKQTGLENLKTLGLSETDCFKKAMNLHLQPEDLQKSLSQLSRGQLTKLEFVKLLAGQNHLLILDEPTNHLEIETREEIEEALKNYQGAIIVASHDRYFLQEIGINRQLILENGKLEEI